MGVALTLLVVDGNWGHAGYSHTLLRFGDNAFKIFDSIDEECQPHARRDFRISSYVARVPDGSKKDEHCYGEISTDEYGDELTYVYASDLAKCLSGSRLDDLNEFQAAIGAYLAHLPPNTLIALHWS